jgi:hypothetical protein
MFSRPRPWSEPGPPSSKSARVWVRPAHGCALQIRGLTLRIWEHQRPSSLSALFADRPPDSTRASIRGGQDRVHHEWTPTHRAGGVRPRNPRTPRNIRDAQGFGPAVEYAISRDSGRRRCGAPSRRRIARRTPCAAPLTQPSGGAIGRLTCSGHGPNVLAGDDAIFIDQTLLALGARPSAAQISTALGQPDMQAASLA